MRISTSIGSWSKLEAFLRRSFPLIRAIRYASSFRPCISQKRITKKFPQNPSTPLQTKVRKRKRSQEAEDLLCISADRLRKRPRTLPSSAVENSNVKDIPSQQVASNVFEDKVNPIDYWRKEQSWPKEYQRSNMSHLLAKKKLTLSLCHKQSESSSVASSSTLSD